MVGRYVGFFFRGRVLLKRRNQGKMHIFPSGASFFLFFFFNIYIYGPTIPPPFFFLFSPAITTQQHKPAYPTPAPPERIPTYGRVNTPVQIASWGCSRDGHFGGGEGVREGKGRGRQEKGRRKGIYYQKNPILTAGNRSMGNHECRKGDRYVEILDTYLSAVSAALPPRRLRNPLHPPPPQTNF